MPWDPLCKNVTSSTKPEVRNVLKCRQRRTETRPQATRTNIWWNSAVWFSSYASGQTDRQTDILITIFKRLPEEVMKQGYVTWRDQSCSCGVTLQADTRIQTHIQTAVHRNIHRLCMKLFKTGSIDVVKDCQNYFAIDLPSSVLKKRQDKFIVRYKSTVNNFCKFCIIL